MSKYFCNIHKKKARPNFPSYFWTEPALLQSLANGAKSSQLREFKKGLSSDTLLNADFKTSHPTYYYGIFVKWE